MTLDSIIAAIIAGDADDNLRGVIAACRDRD